MPEQPSGPPAWAAPDDPSGPARASGPTAARGSGRLRRRSARATRHRPAWLAPLLALLVVLAVASPVALLSRSGARASAGARLLPVPRVATSTPAPATGGVPAPGGGPGGSSGGGGGGSTSPAPLPSGGLGLVETPPALARLGYRAVTIRSVSPATVATDAGEITEFRRDGLQSITSLELVGVGRPGGDYLAMVYVLRFPNRASAERELAYSNKANRASGYRDIPVPGVPGATGLTKTPAAGRPQVTDFAVTDSRQLFVGLRQVGGDPTVAGLGAEAAKVLAALIPDSADVVPPDPGSTPSDPSTVPDPGVPTPDVPDLPTPTPTGQRA